MAVFYKLFGAVRGKLGQVIFYEKNDPKKGQWYGRAYNPHPKNPRTIPQMQQRAKFAMSAKFYKRAVSHFFKFAYEDQRVNESAYNAFMRHNISAALVAPQSYVKNASTAAIGNLFMMSEGGLGSPFPGSYSRIEGATGINAFANGVIFQDFNGTNATDTPTYGEDYNVKVGLNLNTSALNTVGGNVNSIASLSKVLIAGGAENGDIITFITINWPVLGENPTVITEENYAPPYWDIYQFFINDTDNRPLTDIAHKGRSQATFSFHDDVKCLMLDAEFRGFEWASLIITRKDGQNKMLANTSYLYANGAAQRYASDMLAHNGEYIMTWATDLDEAILEGSLATRGQVGDDETVTIETVNGSAIPATIDAPSDQHGNGTVTLTVVGKNLDKAAAPIMSNRTNLGQAQLTASVTNITNNNTGATITIGIANSSSTDFSFDVLFDGKYICRVIKIKQGGVVG